MQDWIIEFITNYGYVSIFFLIMIENVFPPIPSELILTFGGFITTYTSMTVPGVIIASTAGSIVGAIILYGIGYLINPFTIERIVDRWGHILRLKVEDIHKASGWFQRYGNFTVFFCRMIPIIRSLISIPAGMARMNKGFFLIFTTLGTVIWNTVLVISGAWLGESWGLVLQFMATYSHAIYLILIILALVLIVSWFYKKRK